VSVIVAVSTRVCVYARDDVSAWVSDSRVAVRLIEMLPSPKEVAPSNREEIRVGEAQDEPPPPPPPGIQLVWKSTPAPPPPPK
jgi:hypothetical protein